MSEKRPRGIVAADHLITIFCLLRQTSSSGHLLQPQRSLCSLAELLFSVLLLLHPTYSSPISRNIAQAPSPRYVPSAVRPMKLERSILQCSRSLLHLAVIGSTGCCSRKPPACCRRKAANWAMAFSGLERNWNTSLSRLSPPAVFTSCVRTMTPHRLPQPFCTKDEEQ